MLIYNPTNQAIVAKHDGGTFLFKAGEKREIVNEYAARHILNRWEKYGLVDITYNERVAMKYSSPSLFVHEMGLQGLEAAIETIMRKIEYFDVYIDECGDKKSIERRRFEHDREKVKATLAELEAVQKRAAAITQDDLVAAQIKELEEQAQSLKSRLNSLKGTKGADKSPNA